MKKIVADCGFKIELPLSEVLPPPRVFVVTRLGQSAYLFGNYADTLEHGTAAACGREHVQARRIRRSSVRCKWDTTSTAMAALDTTTRMRMLLPKSAASQCGGASPSQRSCYWAQGSRHYSHRL